MHRPCSGLLLRRKRVNTPFEYSLPTPLYSLYASRKYVYLIQKAMNDFERLNCILAHLKTQPWGDYVLDYCVGQFGGQRATHFDLIAQLILDGYAQSDPGDLQFLCLTPEGEIFLEKGGYPVPLRERVGF